MLVKTLPISAHPLVDLRPLRESDLSTWFAYLSLPVVHEHTTWHVTSIGQLAQFVSTPDNTTPTSTLRLAVVLRTTDELVGAIGFHTVSPEHRTVELAYDFAPSMWGRGVATALAGVAVQWAHADEGFLRVQATVLDSNHRSAAVLERCGFVHEGLMRSYRMVRGTPRDFHLYAHVVSPGAVRCSTIGTMRYRSSESPHE